MAAPIQTDRAPDNPDEKGVGTDDQALIGQAIKRWTRANTAEAVMRQEAMEDDKFKAGDQWPAQIRSDRTIQKRPCLTINKMPTFVNQVTNEHKMNRPQINIAPVGDKSDPQTAKMLKGLIRQIERQSRADTAYDWGFDSMVSGGWGFWRIVADYEDDRTFDQALFVRRIENRFTVYMDPMADPIGTDAEWCFISDLMPRDEFSREHPKADPVNWQETGSGDSQQDWSTETHVRVSEYYYFEYKKRVLVALATGHIGFEDELAPEVREQIAAEPALLKSKRDVEVRQLKWCKLTAKEVLDRRDLPGKWIPVVRCPGTVNVVEGKVNYSGLVRFAKDAQRMYNFWCTAETELIALQPKAPWIMEKGQVEGQERQWKRANIDSQPYLLYNGVSVGGKQAPIPQRQPFQGSPDGVVKAKIGAAQDMQATTGVRFDATLQERMQDESGRALVELKRIGEMGQFHFTDQFLKALQHTGSIFIDLIPKYYDTRRVLTILREDDSEETVTLDPNMPKAVGEERTNDGGVRSIFNPNVGKYDVTVTTGPNYATKRQEAADQMLNFLKIMPNEAPLVADLMVKNMDWPDSDVLYERLASRLPPELQMKQMKNMPPQARALIASLQQQLQKLSGEHQQALNLLGEKKTEQGQEQQKIDNTRTKAEQDYDAKMAKIFADLMAGQQKMGADIEAKQTDSAMKVLDTVSKISLAVEKFQADQESADKQREHEREMAMTERVERETEQETQKEQMSEMFATLREEIKQATKKAKVTRVEPVRAGDKRMARLHYDDKSTRDVALH